MLIPVALIIIPYPILLPSNLNAAILIMPAFIATKNIQTTHHKFGKKKNGITKLFFVVTVSTN
jgi:hypothetical protein